VQYHELRVTFEFEELANIPGVKGDLNATLWADYVYLDQEERELTKILRRKVPCGMYSDIIPTTHFDVRQSPPRGLMSGASHVVCVC
jgi:hypothetical protein